jgi:hypothetical protein
MHIEIQPDVLFQIAVMEQATTHIMMVIVTPSMLQSLTNRDIILIYRFSAMAT